MSMLIAVNERFGYPENGIIKVEARASLAQREGDDSLKLVGETQDVTRAVTREMIQHMKVDPLREYRKEAIIQAVSDLFDREFPQTYIDIRR